MTDNRRVRMTKTMMKSALLELLEIKPLEKITVTDLCRCADVNRSTFYAYYSGVGELLTELEDDVLQQLPMLPDAPQFYNDENFIHTLESFFDYVRENERLFRTLLVQRIGGNFNHRLVNAVMEKYAGHTDSADNVAQYAYIYCVYGVIGMLRQWLSDGFSVSSRSIAEIVLRMSANVDKLESQ